MAQWCVRPLVWDYVKWVVCVRVGVAQELNLVIFLLFPLPPLNNVVWSRLGFITSFLLTHLLSASHHKPHPLDVTLSLTITQPSLSVLSYSLGLSFYLSVSLS